MQQDWRNLGPRGFARRRPPSNLPAQPTAIIGREHELAAARRLLLAPDVRLLTVTGPGGAGKTRLAVKIAADLLEAFEDGAFFVDLASVSDPSLVVPTVARTLGVRERRGQPPLERLRSALRHKRALVLLDNFEQVLGAAPELAELLAACPHLKLLATSRAPLSLRWEHVLPTPPLALPDLERPPTLDLLTEVPSVALFLERARAVAPHFRLTHDNARAVAEICVRLDGLPLSIELAAARADVVLPQAILGRLERRLDWLTGGPRDLPARQQTLRAALGWSYELLGAEDQALFRRLGVFVGSFSLEAAEAIVRDAGTRGRGDPGKGERDSSPCPRVSPSPCRDVLDGLVSLVRNSLLRQENSEVGEPRFRLLDTIREYALERLAASGELEAVRSRHADEFLALAERAAPGLLGPEQAAWLGRLERDHDNLRAALQWSAERETAEAELRLCGALWRFWWLHGYLSEGQRRLEQALIRRAAAPAPVRAKAVNAAGILAHVQGDHERAASFLEESLSLWRACGDKQGIAAALHNLGALARELGDHERAAALCTESLALEREMGNKWGIATSLSNLGALARDQGDRDRAAALHAESLTLQRELGDIRGVAGSLHHLAEVARDGGDWRRAAALEEESLALWRELGDRWGIAISLHDLGKTARLQGDHERAGSLLRESLALFVELGVKQGSAACLEELAGVACLEGRPERAARLFGAAEALREAIGSLLPPADRAAYARVVAAARTKVAAAAFAAARAAGRAMPPERAVEEALAYQDAETGTSSDAGVQGHGEVELLPATDTPGLLTRREREVAVLVAQGLTNRQIAHELVISELTAETHVKHVLGKLGFTSRAQVAGWAVRQGLLPESRLPGGH